MSILIYGDTFQLDVSSGSQFGNQTGKWAGIYAPLFKSNWPLEVVQEHSRVHSGGVGFETPD